MVTKKTEYTYRWKKKNPDAARESHRLAQLRWRAKNRERVRANMKAWATNNRDKINAYRRKQHFREQYGITIEERDAMFAAQGFKCAACPATEPGSKNGWVVDHRHEPHKVRGVLCHHCNLGIGNARENIETLKRWIEYIERHA